VQRYNTPIETKKSDQMDLKEESILATAKNQTTKAFDIETSSPSNAVGD
jgi:hypothetical protein